MLFVVQAPSSSSVNVSFFSALQIKECHNFASLVRPSVGVSVCQLVRHERVIEGLTQKSVLFGGTNLLDFTCVHAYKSGHTIIQ
jgi:hypothetical protein